MEERVGQAVTAGKAEAEKVQQAGGSQVLIKLCTSMFVYVKFSCRQYPVCSHLCAVLSLLQVCPTNVLVVERELNLALHCAADPFFFF